MVALQEAAESIVDEGEKVGKPGHLVILRQNQGWRRLAVGLIQAPLVCGFGAAH